MSVYDPVADHWSDPVALPVGSKVDSCVEAGDRILVKFGGPSDGSAGDPDTFSGVLFDPSNGSLASIELPGVGRRDGAAVAWLDDQFAVWGGGVTGDGAEASVRPGGSRFRPA